MKATSILQGRGLLGTGQLQWFDILLQPRSSLFQSDLSTGGVTIQSTPSMMNTEKEVGLDRQPVLLGFAERDSTFGALSSCKAVQISIKNMTFISFCLVSFFLLLKTKSI